MPMAGFIVGFGDFLSKLSLHQVAEVLSLKAFGGIRFVEKDVDGEHDLGTLTLEHDFLGIQVDLFGTDGSYTLEVCMRPWASVEGCPDVCDISKIMLQRLWQIEEITVEPKERPA